MEAHAWVPKELIVRFIALTAYHDVVHPLATLSAASGELKLYQFLPVQSRWEPEHVTVTDSLVQPFIR